MTSQIHEDILYMELLSSVINDDIESIALYLSYGLTLDHRYNIDIFFDRHPLLYLACLHSNIKTVKYLLLNGADPNIEINPKETVLYMLVKENKIKCVDLLVKHGANPNIQDLVGCTAISRLDIQKTHSKLIKKLLALGADPGLGSESGSSLLARAINLKDWCSRDQYIINNNKFEYELACYIIDHSNNILPKNELAENKNNELFLKYSRNGYIKKLKDLISNCIVDLNYTDDEGNNALLLSAKNGSIKVFMFLHDSGLNLFYTNHHGENSLHLASKYGNTDVVDYLLNNGLNINQTTNYDETPLMCAVDNNKDDVGLVKFLIKNNADINYRISIDCDRNKYDCLAIAIENGNLECVRTLVGLGIDINDCSQLNKDYELNKIPIFIAALEFNGCNRNDNKSNRLVDIIYFLLESGADINLDDNTCQTFVDHIVFSGKSEEFTLEFMKNILNMSHYKVKVIHDRTIERLSDFWSYPNVADLLTSYRDQIALDDFIYEENVSEENVSDENILSF